MRVNENPKAEIYVKAGTKEDGIRAIKHFFNEGDTVALSATYKDNINHYIYYLRIFGFSSKAKTLVEILVPVKIAVNTMYKSPKFPHHEAEEMLFFLKSIGLKVKYQEELVPA